MNIFRINLDIDEDKQNSVFSSQNSQLWVNLRKQAVGRGAFALKMRIREKFESLLPAAANPLKSINPYTKRRWKGRLIDLIQQGKIDEYDGYVQTDVMMKDRRSGYGSWIGIIFNKGNFNSQDRVGKKKGKFKDKKDTNIFYHKRGNIAALNFFEQGYRGFDFSTTVDDLLSKYINQLS